MRRTRNIAEAARTVATATKNMMLSANVANRSALALARALDCTMVTLMTHSQTAAPTIHDNKRAHLDVPRRATFTVAS